MLDAYPELTVVLAHMGGWKQWDEILEALAGRRSRLRVAARAPIVPPLVVSRAHCILEKPDREVRP